MMDSTKCNECSGEVIPIAEYSYGVWMLYLGCTNPLCLREDGPKLPWPFERDYATIEDLAKLGFKVIPPTKGNLALKEYNPIRLHQLRHGLDLQKPDNSSFDIATDSSGCPLYSAPWECQQS